MRNVLSNSGIADHRRTFSERIWTVYWPLIVLITCIATLGIIALWSVAGGSFAPYAERQTLRFIAGLALLFAVSAIPIRVWMALAYPAYLLALLALVAVWFIGVEMGGAKRWISIAGFSFQSSELMKVAIVLTLARYYQTLPHHLVSRPIWVLLPMLLIAVPVFLVLKQPDLGTSILIATVGFTLMFLAGVNWFYWIAMSIGGVVAAPYIWESLRNYQKERILTFLDPDRDPLGAGYHILQSKIALGSGGFSGRGLMQGTQSQLNFLPEKHTDFLFAVFAEEAGFAGSISLLGLYLMTVLVLMSMALRCNSQFARLITTGAAIALIIYTIVNVAMVIGMLPVVGAPLPLFSYGGSAMLTTMFLLGLAMSAYLSRDEIFRK